MSVLIKNATMPSNCGNCKLALGRTYCLACMLTGHIVDDFGKSPACPLEEVVQCKDCEFFCEDDGEWGVCENTGAGMKRTGFCSNGERKDDE